MDRQGQTVDQRKAKRSAYNKKHYQEHKEEIRANYNAQTQYVRWVEVKKTLFRCKKKIGSISYEVLCLLSDRVERVFTKDGQIW